MLKKMTLAGVACAVLSHPALAIEKKKSDLHALIARHAQENGVPETLVHRVIQRESRYNPGAVGRGGTLGLMQIKAATARALGYSGSPSGLLDAETNLTYGVRYLAGAYRVAGGDQNRAIAYFARGYYYDAKRKGMLAALAGKSKTAKEDEEDLQTASIEDAPSASAQPVSAVSAFAPASPPYFEEVPR